MPTARTVVALLLAAFLGAATAPAQSFDPPANYYDTATGTGATLKQQLNDIIDGHTNIGYAAARSALQVTDADVSKPGYMITVYDRKSLNVAALGGSPPGWDGTTWNREHTWPRSRGVDDSGIDDNDLFNLRPSLTAGNSARANFNFGGAFGQSYGLVDAVPNDYWYPGDAEAGMIARQQFYMAVRYDGTESGTTNLELANDNPGASMATAVLGELSRLMEWHFLVPPDAFERRRNQIIYDQYQHNRDPFIDRPEYAWSVFVDQSNDSSLTLQGASPATDGATSLNVDLGRVLVGGPTPASQSVVLNKSGLNGTYYQVTTAGLATSSVTGRYNAFATSAPGSKSINVGLATDTASPGVQTGAVTIDNLDVTTAGGAGRGANDGNDVINLTFSVLSHANASFHGASDVNSLTYDFGVVDAGTTERTFAFDVFNYSTNPGITAGLDLDAIVGTGDTNRLAAGLSPFNGSSTLAAGQKNSFLASFDASVVGEFSATYALSFSDENLPGATSLAGLTLSFTGVVQAPAVVTNADFDADADVDGADFLTWQRGLGTLSVATRATGDANGDEAVDADDLAALMSQFGAPVVGSSQGVPEPAGGALAALALVVALRLRPRDSATRQEKVAGV